MLETLNIKNFAIISHAEVPFKSGLNILSGETGAGKSIIIEAISLLLGSRANSEFIRSGSDEAIVEGLFDLADAPWMRKRLENMGFQTESAELLIKRVVHRAGRHRIYVNGELATLTILQELCEGLVDLCGQHEHQSLLKGQTQLDLVDRYGGLQDLSRNFSTLFSHYRSLKRERDALKAAEDARASKADYLRFQIDELRSAELEPGEDEKLQAEKKLLQSGEARVQGAEAVREFLESEDGILDHIRTALSKLRPLAQLDERAQPMHDGLERALAEAEEVSISLNRYLHNVDLDPERLGQVQERLSLLADLRRKYGSDVNDMINRLSQLEKELSEIDGAGTRLEEIESQMLKIEEDLRKLGRKLSQSRKKVADLLAKSVTDELKDLKMGDARFLIELSPREDMSTWTPAGADNIQFVVQTNKGEAAKPLGKIASGGELSRLMLSIRRVIADRGGIGVYLFDEIDAGIGGQTAFQVGKKLKSVAGYNQVICITHLPQVASFADHHLCVRKSSHGGRTLTEIAELKSTERKQELARMLGGPELTKKSLENAAELIELAR